MGDYIIKDITAKDGGRLTELHQSAMGAECLIVDLEKGERSLLRYKPDYDQSRYHRLHTSVVVDYTVSEDGNDVTIETTYSVYHLVRCNFGDDFTGINAYTIDVAKNTVTDFFKEQDDDYFAKRGVTKEYVLGNDDLLSRCATIHHRLIKEAGLDYAWACDFACSHALAEERAPVYVD